MYYSLFLEDDTSDNTLALWGMGRDWYAQFLLDNNRFNEALSQFQV
jgi:hypothetical protein